MRALGPGSRMVVVVAALALACLAALFGGAACDTAPPPGASATGGQPGTGGAATGGAGTGGALGGDASIADDGPARSTDACNDGDLWDLISEYEMTKLRLGGCSLEASGTNTIVFDARGAIVDISGTPAQQGPTKAEWLQLLSERRWPCRAGQTVHYSCFAD
jgi:hypothetical protein